MARLKDIEKEVDRSKGRHREDPPLKSIKVGTRCKIATKIYRDDGTVGLVFHVYTCVQANDHGVFWFDSPFSLGKRVSLTWVEILEKSDLGEFKVINEDPLNRLGGIFGWA